MSYFYKQNFVSPEVIFAKVKEELRSYFESGIVDDTLFPLYVEHCLRKLGKASYPINQVLLHIDGYKSNLPEDFYAAREVWACTTYTDGTQLPSSTYLQQMAYKMDTLTENDVYCRPCETCKYPDVIEAVYKVTNAVYFQYRKQYLLTPGNIFPSCPEDLYCANYNSVSPHSYDIRDKKIATTFREGKIYMQYYSTGVDDADNQLVPDNIQTLNYIEYYIKQKMFEQVWNQTTDETYNQSQGKFQYYKAQADEAFIIATTENKKKDQYSMIRSIAKTRTRFRKFNIR